MQSDHTTTGTNSPLTPRVTLSRRTWLSAACGAWTSLLSRWALADSTPAPPGRKAGGDFGRSPQINKDAGRDHWPQCYSMVLADGGIRGGQVVGESDKIGAYPLSRPIKPADVHATVYTALGYDPHAVNYRSLDGRPMLLADGKPISEVL